MIYKSKTKCIGILTSGGDCPGLNAAIRGVAKAAIHHYGIKVLGIQDGFRGLVENRFIELNDAAVSGILTKGGTLLGTSRDKPHKMPMGGKKMDMTKVAIENAKKMQIDCLVCLGGGGTQKNAMHLHREGGLNVLTLPKTIDNDVAETELTFGFDTALQIATDAIDRLHTTATSHHRIIVCEIMGHRAGWLALGAGLAGGADIILIPEIPYDINVVAEHIMERRRHGKKFSIVAVAEGAVSKNEDVPDEKALKAAEKHAHKALTQFHENSQSPLKVDETLPFQLIREPNATKIARKLEQLTGKQARVTELGHVQRGGTPSSTDRLLCTLMGTKAAELLAEGTYNVMVSLKNGQCVPVPLENVAGKKKLVPIDHDWVQSARLTGICMGDHQADY